MDGKRVDISERSASDTTLLGDQNELPFGEGKASCASSERDTSGTDQSGACPTLAKIQEWTDRANISFKYTKKKIEQAVREAKEKMRKREAKKMPEESGCNHLECTQCKVSFLSEAELREHYDSDEHLAKVRAKSESKTLGDLKLFARYSENNYHRQARAYLADREAKAAEKEIEMAKQYGCNHLECDLCNKSFHSESDFMKHHGSEEHLVKVPLECNLNKESFQSVADLREHCDNEESPGLPAAINFLGVNSFDVGDLSDDDVPLGDLFVGEEMIDIGDTSDVTEESHATDVPKEKSRVTIITTLREEVDRLRRENIELKEQNKKNEEKILRLKPIDEEASPENLQNIVQYLKKNEEGYDFDDAKYYRMMSVLGRPCFSVREIVTKLISCSFKINRTCGNYGERSQKRGGEEEEEEKTKKKRSR